MQVVAISYDDQKILQAFAEQREIEYPLLSDSDSKVIDKFKIRNEEVKGGRIDGVPYPGTFVIDTNGKVVAKLFHEGYRKRHAAADIIKAAKAINEKE